MNKILQSVWLLISVVSLQACGFHLRGNYVLPDNMHEIYLDTNKPYGELARGLRRALKNTDAMLLDEAGEDVAVLKITQEQTRRRVLSVGADGRAQEYEIAYTVRFLLTIPQSTKDPVESGFTLTRDYAFDPTGVLASGGEAAMLERDMQRDAVRLIMQRLAALSHQ